MFNVNNTVVVGKEYMAYHITDWYCTKVPVDLTTILVPHVQTHNVTV